MTTVRPIYTAVTRSLLFLMLILSALFVIVYFVYVSVEQYNQMQLKKEKERLAVQEQLRQRLDGTIDYINLVRRDNVNRLNDLLKERVYEAYNIASVIYNESKGKMPDESIKRLIKESFRNLRFFNGRGYFFIADLSGKEILYPVSPDKEGLNLYNLTDPKGNYPVQDEISVIKNYGEGFVTNYWPKPYSKDDKLFPKTSFVKEFKPFGWFIGTGEYLDNIELDVQRTVLNNILNDDQKKNSFLFVLKANGKAIFNSDSTLFEKSSDGRVLDAYGVDVLRELRRLSMQPNGGYVVFYYNVKNHAEPHPVLFYIKLIHGWDWMVAYGSKITSLEISSELYLQQLNANLWSSLFKVFIGVILVLLAFLIIMRRLTDSIKQNTQKFENVMEAALVKSEMIDPKDYDFKEFQDLAAAFNTLISKNGSFLERLNESEERYRLIATQVSDVIFTIISGLKFEYVSPSVSRITGYRQEEISNFNLEHYFRASDRRRVKLSLGRIMYSSKNSFLQGTIYQFELNIVKSDGALIPMEVRLAPIYGKDRKFINLLGVARDLSERKKAQVALEESEVRYRLLATNALDLIWSMDLAYQFTYLSPSVYKLEGYTPEERLGMPLHRFLPPESFIVVDDQLKKLVNRYKEQKNRSNVSSQGFSASFEIRQYKKDGSVYWADVKVGLSIAADGYPSGFNGITRDITERKKAEQELRDSEAKLRKINATKDKFFSIIAHDLRNPFSSLVGFTSMLSEQFDNFSDSEKLTIINQLRITSETAYRLLENLLEWSRSETGTMSLSPVYFDFDALCQEVLVLHRPHAQRKNIEISYVPCPVKQVFADRNMIGTVLRNLVSNAVKFTREGGLVVIDFSVAENKLVVIVRDSGVGIPLDMQKRLFSIDQKVKTSGTYNEPGSGLGLILCNEFVLLNGGKLSLESVPDKGSVFSFTLSLDDHSFSNGRFE